RLMRAAGTEALEIDIEPDATDALSLKIQDGGSPPLADLQVVGLMRQTALVFAMAPGPPGEPAGTLYFGGQRAWLPRYDLANLFGDSRAAGGPNLADATALPLAELGPARPNPHFDKGPALAPMMRAGAKLDSRAWRWTSAVRFQQSHEGVVQV